MQQDTDDFRKDQYPGCALCETPATANAYMT